MTKTYGDKMALSFDQRDILENQILPAARRWLSENPELAEHGRKTLAHWGEWESVKECQDKLAQREEERNRAADYVVFQMWNAQ